MEQPRRHYRRTRHRRRMTMGFALIGAILVAFVVAPIAGIFLTTSPAAIVETALDPQVLAALGLTLYAAALATLIALITGIPLAYLLARHDFPGRSFVEGVMDLPVVIPHTAAGIALLTIFGRHGPIGRVTGTLGLQFTGSLGGIVIAMLFVSLPFLLTNAREAFAAIDPEMESVALTLGANEWQAFRYVTLPLAWRGILAGVLMTWARGMSEFGAVIILAYNPKIIPVLIYERFAGFGLEAALPVAVILITAVLAIFTALRTFLMPKRDIAWTEE